MVKFINDIKKMINEESGSSDTQNEDDLNESPLYSLQDKIKRMMTIKENKKVKKSSKINNLIAEALKNKFLVSP